MENQTDDPPSGESEALVQDVLDSETADAVFDGAAQAAELVELPATQLQQPQVVTHNVYLWINGFTVDDGPFRGLDDVENASFLESIRNSECPKELQPTKMGTAVFVNIITKEESYNGGEWLALESNMSIMPVESVDVTSSLIPTVDQMPPSSSLLHYNGAESERDPESNMLHQPLLKRNLTLSSSPLAMVGAKVSYIESLDYEINENDLFKHDWRSRSRTQVLQYIFGKWTLAFLVGLLTGIIATLINLAVENIAGYKLLAVAKYIDNDRYLMAFLYFAGANFLLTFVAAFLCVFFAPTAAGPGIPRMFSVPAQNHCCYF